MTGFNNALDRFTKKLIEKERQIESGNYLLSGMIISALISIPILFLLVFSEKFFIAIKQYDEIAYEASRFLLGLSPGLIFIS